MKTAIWKDFRKDHLAVIFGSFFTAWAFTMDFHMPFNPDSFETVIDYVISSIYELLGDYNINFLFFLGICLVFYAKVFPRILKIEGSVRLSAAGLAFFFALCLLMGQSYSETGSWAYCFGSAVNFIKFTAALAGYGILLYAIAGILYLFLTSRCFVSREKHFFTSHAFGKAFFILLGSYAPFIVLSFPGNLCWDAIGQIEQVIGDAGYSAHHPLFHTLLMGGFLKLSGAAAGSYDLGLFFYILLQAVLVAAALAATIAVLSKRGAKFSLLLGLLLLYCITPVYSNAVTTALKDVPYSAFMTGYMICFAQLMEKPERIRNGRFVLIFVLLQTGVILFRNNGSYVVLLSGIGCFCVLMKKFRLKERIRLFFSAFGGSLVIAGLILVLLFQTLHAAPGSRGEMLSIPFQQTARYLQLYRQELAPEEKEAIEVVLGDVEEIAARYDPDSSDPVKALFYKEASGKELAAYLKVWFMDFWKHPSVYMEAFLAHVYGWFTPALSNSIRYEAEYDKISQGGLFANAEKLLIFYYRFAARIPLLGILENVGAGVWALFYLVFYQRSRKRGKSWIMTLPLWISLLVCMASPGFLKHPRYAFPLLFTLPFLYAFELTGKAQGENGQEENGQEENVQKEMMELRRG